MGYRVGQYQAAYSDDQADQKGSPPKHYIDAAFCGLQFDFVVLIPLAIHGIKIIARGLGLLHRDQRLPEGHITPTLICLDHGIPVRRLIDLFEFATGFLDQALETGFPIIHSGAGLAREKLVG